MKSIVIASLKYLTAFINYEKLYDNISYIGMLNVCMCLLDSSLFIQFSKSID